MTGGLVLSVGDEDVASAVRVTAFLPASVDNRARVSAFTLVDGGLGAGRGGRGLWLRDDKDFKYAARRGRCCLAGTLKFIPRSRYVE